MAQKKNSYVHFRLQSALDKRIFPRIGSCTTISEAWKSLKDGYQVSEQVKQVKIQSIKREFGNLKMQEEENVSEYYVRVKACMKI